MKDFKFVSKLPLTM